MNKTEILKKLQARSCLHHHNTRQAMEAWFKKALESHDSDESKAHFKDLCARAYQAGDVEAFRQLNAIRQITVQNFITAKANAAAFFEEVILQPAEVPYLVNSTRQEISARFVGADGKLRMTPAVKQQSQFPIELRTIATDAVELPLVDIYHGQVLDQGMANINLSDDAAMKVNAELWALVQASVGNFVTTGPKEKRTYNLHSSVRAGNLPTTNLITLASNSGSTKFRFAVIRAIIQWCLSFGNNSLSIGEMSPQVIFVPSAHLGDLLDEIDVDSPDNSIVEEIRDLGYVLKLGGRQFTLIGDSTLDPAAFRCYVKTNVPLGLHFKKPSLDQTFPGSPSEITRAEREANRTTMSMSLVHGALAVEQQRMGVVAVQYRTV